MAYGRAFEQMEHTGEFFRHIPSFGAAVGAGPHDNRTLIKHISNTEDIPVNLAVRCR